jgi:hypothetical protein
VDEFKCAASGRFPEPEMVSPVREREAARNALLFPGSWHGKEELMNRVAIVATTTISLWVGSMVDQEKLEYLIAGALFTLAMEGLARFILWVARKAARPKVHQV